MPKCECADRDCFHYDRYDAPRVTCAKRATLRVIAAGDSQEYNVCCYCVRRDDVVVARRQVA